MAVMKWWTLQQLKSRKAGTRKEAVERLAADGYSVLPPLPNWEVATREGIEQQPPFPMPTLLTRMSAALDVTSAEGRARR